MPSMESLEATWGSTWRPKLQKYVFCGRKAIVDFITRKLHELDGETNVAEHLFSGLISFAPNGRLTRGRRQLKMGIERNWLSDM